MPMSGCRHFNGYKPCGKSDVCAATCASYDVPVSRLLIVHLEALGAVLRSTALLPALKRKFPGSHITWVTQAPAHRLLAENPLVDRALTTGADDLLALSALEFDAAFVVDKSLKAVGAMRQAASIDMVYGFDADARTGAIVPATPAAQELWEIGLSDRKKFFENRKPETQLACEALELGPWRRDEYVLRLSADERALAQSRRAQIEGGRDGVFVVGLNTGCSPTGLPHKKLSVEGHRALARRLAAEPGVRVALLGGPEDRVRNERIAHGLDVALTPVDLGLRDGLVSVAACDAVVSGDSLGMHMAIALKKWTVAWFGPTCEQEIDLYGRGRKVLSTAPCAPCWKRSCAQSAMCYDLVSIEDLAQAALAGRDQAARQTQDEREAATCPPTRDETKSNQDSSAEPPPPPIALAI